MATARLSKPAGWGLLLAGICGMAAGGCTTGSARADYYASRSITHIASTGDGSIIAVGPGSENAAWQTSLTFVPLSGPGDLADNR